MILELALAAVLHSSHINPHPHIPHVHTPGVTRASGSTSHHHHITVPTPSVSSVSVVPSVVPSKPARVRKVGAAKATAHRSGSSTHSASSKGKRASSPRAGTGTAAHTAKPRKVKLPTDVAGNTARAAATTTVSAASLPPVQLHRLSVFGYDAVGGMVTVPTIVLAEVLKMPTT